jgi:hypothetical protein
MGKYLHAKHPIRWLMMFVEVDNCGRLRWHDSDVVEESDW